MQWRLSTAHASETSTKVGFDKSAFGFSANEGQLCNLCDATAMSFDRPAFFKSEDSPWKELCACKENRPRLQAGLS